MAYLCQYNQCIEMNATRKKRQTDGQQWFPKSLDKNVYKKLISKHLQGHYILLEKKFLKEGLIFDWGSFSLPRHSIILSHSIISKSGILFSKCWININIHARQLNIYLPHFIVAEIQSEMICSGCNKSPRSPEKKRVDAHYWSVKSFHLIFPWAEFWQISLLQIVCKNDWGVKEDSMTGFNISTGTHCSLVKSPIRLIPQKTWLYLA